MIYISFKLHKAKIFRIRWLISHDLIGIKLYKRDRISFYFHSDCSPTWAIFKSSIMTGKNIKKNIKKTGLLQVPSCEEV